MDINLERTILEALPIPAVIADLDLKILETNSIWGRFVLKYGPQEGDCRTGAYYTEVCDPALLTNAENSKNFSEGMTQIVTGKVPRFKMEYRTTHHSPLRRVRLSISLINLPTYKAILILHFLFTGEAPKSKKARKTVGDLHGESNSDHSISAFGQLGSSKGSRAQIHQNLKSPSSIKLAFWEWDIPSDNIRVSSEVSELFGFEPGEEKLKFDSMTARIHPKERTHVMQKFAELLFKGRILRMNHRILSSNGTECQVLSRAIMHYGEEGEPSCISGFFVDLANEATYGFEFAVLVEAFVNAFNNALSKIRRCTSSILTDVHNPLWVRHNALEIKNSVDDIQCLSRLLPLLGEEERSAQAALS